MNGEHDRVAGGVQGRHSVPQAVPRRGLRDVLHQLPPIGFHPGVVLGVVGAQIGEAQFVKLGFRPQLRLVVGQAAPGGQGDKEEVTFTGKADAVGQGHLFPLHGTDGGVLHVIPIADNVRVGLPPVLHNHRQLLLWYAALQGAHVDEGPNAALIAASQRCHLALGAQIGAGAALLDVILGHMKHLGGGGLIDEAVPPEYV